MYIPGIQFSLNIGLHAKVSPFAYSLVSNAPPGLRICINPVEIEMSISSSCFKIPPFRTPPNKLPDDSHQGTMNSSSSVPTTFNMEYSSCVNKSRGIPDTSESRRSLASLCPTVVVSKMVLHPVSRRSLLISSGGGRTFS